MAIYKYMHTGFEILSYPGSVLQKGVSYHPTDNRVYYNAFWIFSTEGNPQIRFLS